MSGWQRLLLRPGRELNVPSKSQRALSQRWRKRLTKRLRLRSLRR